MVDIDIRGAVELRRVALALRQAGNATLRKELLKAIRQSTRPIVASVKANIPGSVPSAYAAILLRSTRFTTRTKMAGWPSVTVVGQAKGSKEQRDLARVNAGILKHPVFGRSRRGKRGSARTPNPWVSQRVQGRFFDRAVDQNIDTVRAEVLAAIDRTFKQL